MTFIIHLHEFVVLDSSFVNLEILKCFLPVCQDEDEFPDLATGGGVQRSNKPESTPSQTLTQPKLPKNLVRLISF